MQREQIAGAWEKTGLVLDELNNTLNPHPLREAYDHVLHSAEIHNPWFTRDQLSIAFKGIVKLLDPVKMKTWLQRYPENSNSTKRVGVIMAGNIPMAGFHDLLCVSLSGHTLLAKLSSSDSRLLPFVTEIFFSFLPGMKERVHFVEQLKNQDAVIATGSNNTSRYFEYYFGKQPHIFRKNRNSTAVLSGKENEYDFILLGKDIFTYYGLGCRNVSKLYVPESYDFNEFFQSMNNFSDVMNHNKYMNNYDYHQSLYLLNRQPFLTNNFLIIREETSLSSPVAVLHYEYYKNEDELSQKLESVKDQVQCTVSKKNATPFGHAQFPEVDDYADGVDTMNFLLEVSAT